MVELLSKTKSIYSVILLVLVSYLLYHNSRHDLVLSKCSSDEFQLRGMDSCHPLLTCEDFSSIRIGKLIGVGAVKAVYHAKWKELDVALSILNNQDYENDFLTGAENVRLFQQNPYTIQAVGFCLEEKMYVTEFHSNGDASKFFKILKKYPKEKDGPLLRINFCINYAQVLNSLHHSNNAMEGRPKLTPRVMCDSNDLDKLLSQFLVTDNLSLVLNDLDAVPLVKDGGIKCGHQELKGEFVAPEQLWKLPGSFVDAEMPGYDEKTDIWKAPSVCNYFLNDVPYGDNIKIQLSTIHKRCKLMVPNHRPTACELARQYIKIKTKLEADMMKEM